MIEETIVLESRTGGKTIEHLWAEFRILKSKNNNNERKTEVQVPPNNNAQRCSKMEKG